MQPVLPPRIDTDDKLWQAFRYHSRTFSFATRLLPQHLRLPIATLYLFCRRVDTVADDLVFEAGPAVARAELDRLRRGLDGALRGHPPEGFLWQRLAALHRRYVLYPGPLYELLDGARWDLDERPIETLDDLVEYSNLVGGSIGAMMLPFLLGDRRRFDEAEAPARTLGIAMQITNIVRDVGEDRRLRQRLYLPLDWLAHHDLTADDLDAACDGPLPEAYPLILENTMACAEARFEAGMAGLDLLDERMRGGIRAAARCYREILNEVREAGYDNLSRRAVVPFQRKCLLLVRDGYARRKASLHARARAHVPA